MDRIRWKEWTALLVVITGITVTIDVYFETHYIGASARFLWNLAIFALLWLVRLAEAGFILLTRRRAMRLTTFVTAIGIGYASSVILNDAQVRKAYTFREKMRVALTKIRDAWLRLPTFWKFVAVGVIIVLQIILLPTFAEWIILFPIAFMVPVFKSLFQWLALYVADSFIGNAYWKYCGSMHRKVMRGAERIPVARQIREAVLLKRLQYLTAWRMWKHEECYRTARGRRRISLFEPVRLWWRGELNTYVGRSLLSGKNAPWPVRTYELPKLWYEHERPFARVFVALCAMLLTLFSVGSSARKRA